MTLNDYIQRKADQFGSMRQLALHWQVKPQFLNAIKKGARPAPDWMLDDLGIERIVTVSYREK